MMLFFRAKLLAISFSSFGAAMVEKPGERKTASGEGWEACIVETSPFFAYPLPLLPPSEWATYAYDADPALARGGAANTTIEGILFCFPF